MSLGQQFNEFITGAYNELPMEKIGQVLMEKTLEDTERGLQPSGEPFAGYAESTRKPDPVRLRDTDFSIESIFQSVAENQTEIGFQQKGEIFELHQTRRAKGGKERRVFPEEQDEAGLPMEQLTDIVTDHFNEY